MGVQIEAMDSGRLKLTGDVGTILDLPARAVTEGFSFAFSDGSLVRGSHDIVTGRCRFSVAAEGAALVRITREGRHDRAQIDGQIAWMTLACGSETLCPIDAEHSDDRRQLKLDIDMKDAA